MSADFLQRERSRIKIADTFYKQLEVKVITSFAATSGVLLVALYIADALWDGSRKGFERWLLLRFRNPADLVDAIGPHYFEEIVRDITSLGGVGIIGLLVITVTVFLYLQRGSRQASLFFWVMVSGMIVSALLKIGFDRPRPTVVPPAMYVASASFPSGHSMLSALAYLTLGAMLARLQPRRSLKKFLLGTGIGIVSAVGLSRVYLGVHWPTDVLGGWMLGSAWALLGLWIEEKFGKRMPPPIE